jgi:magnesium-transporting ATPase (P-type)
MLTGAAAIAAAVGSTVDAALVAGVNLGSALIGGVERVRTDRALSQLFERSATTATVLRDGRNVVRPAENLVPGDVLLLSPGDVIAADCRLLEVDSLEVDESSLTGESMPVAKSQDPTAAGEIAERSSMVYEGTTVTSGEGLAVVVAVGSGTEVGRSMAAAHRAAPTSGVDARLASIMNRTAPIAFGSALAVVGAGLLRGRELQDVVTSAVGLAVAAVPEGLPFMASAAQLAAARRLSQHGILVRNPRTVEALGRVDVLCFDKTGTLTEGRITLAFVSDGRRRLPLSALSSPSHRAVLTTGLRATPELRNGERRWLHATDRAVADGAAGQGIDRGASWRPIDELPFDSSRGFHAVLGELGGQRLLSVKGAPEIVLPRCRVNPTIARQMRAELHRLTAAGYRVLAVAESRSEATEPLTEEPLTDDQVRDLTPLGFLALADPVRRAAGASLAELRDAGIQLLMITGDHPATAQTIAEELELLNGGRVLTGGEIDQLDDERLEEVLPEVTVVARGTPAHKVRIVETFQRLGRTVAMTGDGSNDAPAIRLADVGIALGQRGTNAARAAADLVVTDDRLDTILLALVEGRAMWASVRDGLGILVGGNLGEIAFTVLGALISAESPLTARQLLLVNLLTDLAPALAVAVRPPRTDAYASLVAEGPDRSLGASLERDMVFRAATTAVGAGAAWAVARASGSQTRARTVALTALVATQLGQTLVIGGRDRTVALACLGSGALLAGVVQTPGISQLFGCRPMGPMAWSIALGSAAGATAVATVAQPLVYRWLDVERYRFLLRPPQPPASR